MTSQEQEKEIIEICSTCGFPKNWERSPVFLAKGIFSLISNICKECGHQSDGYAIIKLKPFFFMFTIS